MNATPARALPVWDRKVARLPDSGVLLVSTDLQGNLKDYERLKALYMEEEEAGNAPVLVFCGDMVHGPSEDLLLPGAWPSYLGEAYPDQSRELIIDFERWTREHRAFSLLGNHEHAHIGGPRVAKFHSDEAQILIQALGQEMDRIHSFMLSFPLIAVSGGLVLVHGAPAASEDTLEDFERLDYTGYARLAIRDMYGRGTLSELLWSRYARPAQAQRLLEVCTGSERGIIVYGHDVVREGWTVEGSEQICVSTSFGCFDEYKTYLRLDLSRTWTGVHELREGHEIMRLWP